MTILNAAFRLSATLVESMSFKKSKALKHFNDSTAPDTLFAHYILVHELAHHQELNHWQKECRNLLEKLLRRTRLKSGFLKKPFYMSALWGDHAETSEDCRLAANDILTVEGYSDKDRRALVSRMDFNEVSKDYKFWLSHWYDYYHNPHSVDKYTLPISLF